MSSDWRANRSDDEEDEQEEVFAGRSGLILTVDCSDYMFVQEGESDSRFVQVLHIIEAMMRNKVVTNETDLIGVVFYNTKNNPAPETEEELQPGLVAPRQCAIYLPLGTTSVETIRKVRGMRESKDLFDFDTKYGHAEGTSLSNVLWLCSRMFSHCGYKLSQSTIVLFTGNDMPHDSSTSEYQQALVKARDLQQKEIFVELVPMSGNFDCDKFYKEFLCTVLGEDMADFVPPVYEKSRDRLLYRLFVKSYKKRSMAHLKWYLADDLALGVNVYSLRRSPRYPKKVRLMRSTNEVIVTKRVHMSSTINEDGAEEESKVILPGEQRKSITIGGEKVSFKSEEVAHIKQLLQPGLRLLGFKPSSVIDIAYHLRSCLFLYPNEGYINGSTTLFRALYEKCLEKNQVAFCMLIMRRKQPLKLVALVPQQELGHDPLGEADRHCGFRVEFIPFAGDIRKLSMLEEITVPEVTDEQTDLFKKMIKKVKFKFHPSHFEDPSSQNLYINIESLVFDVEDAELFDSTRPDCEKIDMKLEPILSDMERLFGEDPAEAPKRRRNVGENNDGGEPRAKGARVLPANDEELLQMVKDGKAQSLTVAMLKEYLVKQGVRGLSQLTKLGLIDKILDTQAD
ncbi:X-ray repair cross-complementing protein 6 [Anopheles maculipalpis]|uniref:X-ray repair cross-complementing protein 6 n=1 Tax=Anopheles maculipalpis TaxID=1496333 RepID=UPI0021596636|nr:X-ray repair cross-complementing protein 6 [Anopheles maculipalpis]